MTRPLRIGLIGDYSPDVRAHVAIPRAVAVAAAGLSQPVETRWLETARLAEEGVEGQAGACDALWCVPGSPYAAMDAALAAIRYARERGVPFLGTCGGFQHTLIEYLRDVLGHADADHAESNPDAEMPAIAPLVCSLVGQEGAIRFAPGSRVAAIYGRLETRERYHCSYGLNPRFASLLTGCDLRITGVDENGEARVVELDGHPFFLATLFQPELSAFEERAHPLIGAFLAAERVTVMR